MKERPVLETERLILRAFRESDARDVQRLAGEREIAATTLSIPHPYEDGMAEKWISTHHENFDKGRGLDLAVTSKQDGSLIGTVGLMGIVSGHRAELGYWTGKPYWNRGYCTEAAAAVLEHGFTELGLHRIHAQCMSGNRASGRVLEKLGMRREGLRRHHAWKWGVFVDLELYGILEEEWRRKRE